MRRRMLLFTGALVLTALLSGGLFIALAAQGGTADDPLITKSYIDSVFKPQIMGLIDEAVSEAANTESANLQALITDYENRINNKINEFKTSTGNVVDNAEYIRLLKEAIREKLLSITVTPSDDAQTFMLVSVKSGQKLTCKVGCELILRTGSAVCVGGLLDVTSSSDLSNNSALTQNTLYIAGADGNGLSATADATLLVRGDYSID